MINRTEWYKLGATRLDILTYCPDDIDTWYLMHAAQDLLNNPKINGVQKYDTREEDFNQDIKTKFTKILFPFFGLSQYKDFKNAKRILEKCYYLEFDFENELFYINHKKYKVKEDWEYTYKIQATQIRAIGGIEGYYKFILENLQFDGTFKCLLKSCFEKMCNN